MTVSYKHLDVYKRQVQGRIYSYRASQSALLAAPPEVFIGQRFQDVLPPEASAICVAALQQANVIGHSFGKQYELSLIHI